MYLRVVTYGIIFIVRVIILLIYFVSLSVKEVFYVPKSFIFRQKCLSSTEPSYKRTGISSILLILFFCKCTYKTVRKEGLLSPMV